MTLLDLFESLCESRVCKGQQVTASPSGGLAIASCPNHV